MFEMQVHTAPNFFKGLKNMDQFVSPRLFSLARYSSPKALCSRKKNSTMPLGVHAQSRPILHVGKSHMCSLLYLGL